MVESVAAGVSRLSPVAASYVDWILAENHSPWGGPMNGQRGRQELVRDIIGAVGVTGIVETGTHRGITTQFLWNLTGGPVCSAESNPRLHRFAKRRLGGYEGVNLHLGDSSSLLRKLAADDTFPKDRVFFYLDAHWGDELPLREELEIVRRNWADPVVMIDDFEVPGDPGYGFDDYGPGRRLSFADLPVDAMTGLTVLVPTLPSGHETGGRRGCCVALTRQHADALVGQGLPLKSIE
jgi:hypothetical protein